MWRASALIGLGLVAGCLKPEPLPWPVADDGRAQIAFVIRDVAGQQVVVDPPTDSRERREEALGPADEVVVVEYSLSFLALAAEPPILDHEPITDPGHYRSIAEHTGLRQPATVWRSRAGAPFAPELEPRLPPELARYWIRDLKVCPELEPSELPTSAPARALVGLGGTEAIAFLDNGEVVYFDGQTLTTLLPTRTSTALITKGYALADRRLIVGDERGVIWRLDWEAPAPGFERISAPFVGPGVTAVAGSPDGQEIYAANDRGEIARLFAGTSTIVLELRASGDCPTGGTKCVGPLNLGWVGPGEALLAWRAVNEPDHGVYRFCTQDGVTTANEEVFGPTFDHRPDILVRIGGAWRITGTDHAAFLGLKQLYAYDLEAHSWTGVYGLSEAGSFRYVVDAPAWDGFAFASQNGRFALQPYFGGQQICPSKIFNQQDTDGLAALADGRIVLAVDGLNALVVLNPALVPPNAPENEELEPPICNLKR